MTKRRALLSVSDKSDIEVFAQGLVERGFEILSTGGTARVLEEAGVSVTRVEEITGHAEIMEGRVKTLHPAIHGPLLARRDVPGDMEALLDHGYHPIDVVAVNLYPFRETVASGQISVDEAMSQVDIGGPTMIRAAAKNHASLFVVVDPEDYDSVLEALDAEASDRGKAEGMTGAAEFRRRLAAGVFRHIALYDAAVAAFLEARPQDRDPSGAPGDGPVRDHEDGGGQGTEPGSDPMPAELPALLLEGYRRRDILRYGENPDQKAAFYVSADQEAAGVSALQQHHGKALSYNNLLDLDGVLLSLAPFALSPDPAVCIVKHTTPCGLAIGSTVTDAFGKALRTDPMSAFGSVIASNREIDLEAAEQIGKIFVECIAAPSFTATALDRLRSKKNLRILTFPSFDLAAGSAPKGPLRAKALAAFDTRMADDHHARQAARFLAAHGHDPHRRVVRGIYGGLLAQTPPAPPFYGVVDPDWQVVSSRAPDVDEQTDLAFAWAAVFGVKSNAILLAADGATLGIGAGQMSRVDSSVVAVRKAGDAGLDLSGCALASDAFFPFRDGVDAAASAGVRAIIQPGGSVRDDEVIQAADEHDMAMIFTGKRLFRH